MIKQQKDTLTNVIQNAINEALSNTHTSTIAKVTKITGNTISVKPVFKRVINNVEIELPEFAEVPIWTLQGGANYRIMPIAIGDTALLIFSERCIDDWYLGADNKKPREYRMHDYSDAIAIVGLNNINKAINIPTGHEKVQGNIVHVGNNTQTGNFIISGNITVTGGNITVTGGDVTADGISLKDHVHSGVTAGASNTGGPV